MRVMRNVTLDHTGNYDPSVTRCHTEAHRHIFNTMFRTVQMARGGGGGEGIPIWNRRGCSSEILN